MIAKRLDSNNVSCQATSYSAVPASHRNSKILEYDWQRRSAAVPFPREAKEINRIRDRL